jgi:DUF4097 and DUF4098 domain-containing protein YvlB
MRATTTLGLLLIAAGGWASPAGSAPVDETVPAAKDGTVRISNVSGSLTIETHDAAEVRVTGTTGEKVEKVSVEASGGDVVIEVVLPDEMRGGGGDAHLVIRVPKGADVEAETVSAGVDVEGVGGTLAVESVSGDIDVRAAGDVEVSTVSGRIDVADAAGSVEAESVSGAIGILKCGPSVEATTTSGAIEVGAERLEWVECTSVSGSIVVAGTPSRGKKAAEIRIENFSGSVVLELPAEAGASLEVETFSGDIDSELGGRVERPDHGPGESLDATVGDGSARVSISTFSGSVELRKGRGGKGGAG